MSRIGSTPGPDPYRPTQGPQAPGATPEAAGQARVGSAEATVGTGAAAPLSAGEYARIREQIRANIAQGMSQEEVLRDLVARTTRDRFGAGADPQMAASIGLAFETDPHLKGLFRELFQRATAS